MLRMQGIPMVARVVVLAMAMCLMSVSVAGATLLSRDSRTSPEAISPGEHGGARWNTGSDTVESGEPNTATGAGCGPSGKRAGSTSWAQVTGYGGPITVTTQEPDGGVSTKYDSILFVYPHGSDTSIACNDDFDINDDLVSLQAEVTFDSVAGQLYDIQVGACCSATAKGGETVVDVRPFNDRRAAATPIGAGATLSGTNYAGTTESEEPLSCAAPAGPNPYARTVWFDFHATEAGRAVFRASSANRPVLTVLRGSSVLGCAASDLLSTLTLDVAPGDYLMQVGTMELETGGDIAAAVDFTPAPKPGGAAGSGGSGGSGGSSSLGSSEQRLHAHVTSAFSLENGATAVKKLKVAGAPVGANVKLTCAGGGCPFGSRSFAVKSSKPLDLTGSVRSARLKPGTMLSVQVTAASAVGSVTKFKIRKDKLPSSTSLCLPADATRPKACA